MQLRADEPLFRRKHVVVVGIARACRIEESHVSFHEMKFNMQLRITNYGTQERANFFLAFL
jgi:hypothetical protein